jgi:hypothetical protein
LVIVSVIAPFIQTRTEIDSLIKPIWVFCLRREQALGGNYPYEPPNANEIDVFADSDKQSAEESARAVIEAIQRRLI